MSHMLMPPIVECLEPRLLLSAAEATLVNVWTGPLTPPEMPPVVEIDLSSPLLLERLAILKALFSHPKISSDLMELRHTINMSIVNRTFHSFKQFQVPLPGIQIDDYGRIAVSVHIASWSPRMITALENARLMSIETFPGSNIVRGWIGWGHLDSLAAVQGVVTIRSPIQAVTNGGGAGSGEEVMPGATSTSLACSVQEASLTDGAVPRSGASPASGERLDGGEPLASLESTPVETLSVLSVMPVEAVLTTESPDEATAISNLTRIGDQPEDEGLSVSSWPLDDAAGVLVRAATVLL